MQFKIDTIKFNFPKRDTNLLLEHVAIGIIISASSLPVVALICQILKITKTLLWPLVMGSYEYVKSVHALKSRPKLPF